MQDELPVKIVNGEPRIYSFEKHYITLVLRDRIAKEQEFLNEAKANSEWISSPLSQAVIPFYQQFINSLEVVLRRVEAMEVVE